MSDTQTMTGVEQLTEALETMAFISPLPAPADAPAPLHPRLIEMEFACPKYGTVRLLVGEDFGTLLASNVLGVEPASPEAQACGDDVLRELVNIVCGAVIRRYGLAADERLHMSLPTVQELETPEQWASFVAMPGVHLLDADGHLIAFQTIGLE